MGEREQSLIFWLSERMGRHHDPFARRTLSKLAVFVVFSVLVSGLSAAALVATGAWAIRFSSPAQGAVITFVGMLVGFSIVVTVPWWRRTPPIEGDWQVVDAADSSDEGRRDGRPE